MTPIKYLISVSISLKILSSALTCDAIQKFNCVLESK